LKALADLLMGQMLATLQSLLATLHRFDETGLFLEVTRNNILHQFIGVPALLRCGQSPASLRVRGGNGLP